MAPPELVREWALFVAAVGGMVLTLTAVVGLLWRPVRRLQRTIETVDRELRPNGHENELPEGDQYAPMRTLLIRTRRDQATQKDILARGSERFDGLEDRANRHEMRLDGHELRITQQGARVTATEERLDGVEAFIPEVREFMEKMEKHAELHEQERAS